jgi:hypothetical protein
MRECVESSKLKRPKVRLKPNVSILGKMPNPYDMGLA